ncbi:zinc-dependent alcohol dehydrogenase [Oceanobacillus jeddahense]|uniref:Alcohol dehydrogenase catalytic domain-containing protein n=1 Tax=Oceanobacillus jeddahense TaxID=1462527 RepID=A0ABY5JVY9_9BACI|nr:alcohol dehydrogenase catalytic domain-containing protein [Oceanobacillus jeddahense]UUI04547.1 alcohol dehydrogenase catalytic domain-containing protein [Oceanobacillus jeddahense]
MKVLSWNGPKKMEIEEKQIPELKQNEVLIKVEAVGLCGSEIEGFLGHNSLRVPPLVMGHEFSGHIADIGESVTGVTKGTKVVVNPLLICGTCKQCRRGNETQCENRQIIGIHRSGAFAEYVAVPASAIVEVPEKLDSFAASLAEPLACTFRAVRRAMAAHTVPNILVYGAGAIGLLSSFVAKELGANKIIVADINEDRLQTLQEVGIENTLNNSKDDFEAKLEEIVDYKGIDVVIDAVGFQATRTQSAKVVNPGGMIMNVGLGIDETVVPINHYIRSEITILGSFCYSRQDFQDAVQLLVEEKVTPKGWTEVRTLEDGQQSFMDLVNGEVKNSKIFLDLNK